MAFANTVETVGDAALTRSIIDRSITELNCNITTSIRQYAFRGCAALASVNFPSVASVALGAFWSCTALTKADFSAAVAFANNAFYGCSNLTALILRSTDQLCTASGTPFASSAIASGTGYIYVPKALVDQYKASWSAYAGQVRAIEDWIEICDPYSWAAVAKAIDNGTYATVYSIGDCVPLDLGTEGVVNMQIAAFDADELADGSGKAPISWVSKELLKNTRVINSNIAEGKTVDGVTVYTEGTGSIGGWEKCEIRTYLNDTIKPLIPSDVLAMIKTVTKYSMINNTSGTYENNVATADALWIPSYRETLNDNNQENSGPYYNGLFTDKTSRKKYPAGSSSANDWWMRSAGKNERDKFCYIDGWGNYNGSYNSYSKKGICLGFCT